MRWGPQKSLGRGTARTASRAFSTSGLRPHRPPQCPVWCCGVDANLGGGLPNQVSILRKASWMDIIKMEISWKWNMNYLHSKQLYTILELESTIVGYWYCWILMDIMVIQMVIFQWTMIVYDSNSTIRVYPPTPALAALARPRSQFHHTATTEWLEANNGRRFRNLRNLPLVNCYFSWAFLGLFLVKFQGCTPHHVWWAGSWAQLVPRHGSEANLCGIQMKRPSQFLGRGRKCYHVGTLWNMRGF